MYCLSLANGETNSIWIAVISAPFTNLFEDVLSSLANASIGILPELTVFPVELNQAT